MAKYEITVNVKEVRVRSILVECNDEKEAKLLAQVAYSEGKIAMTEDTVMMTTFSTGFVQMINKD